MPFPERLLVDDEAVVRHLHPHWTTLVPAGVAFLLTCAATGVLVAVVPHGSARSPVLGAVAVVAVVVLIWWVLRPLLRWASTHYVLTTERVLIRTGVLSHTGRDIALGRINDVGFERTLRDRLVGAGTLLIESAGEQGVQRLTDVPRSDEVQQVLNRLIDAEERRRGRM
ncbi:PH domain-containing protein [Jatrophihabitans sp. YIM 134969]